MVINDKQKQAPTPEPILRTRGLNLHFETGKGTVYAVEDMDLTLRRGLTTVILGESGCGKSSLAKAVLRLLPPNVARYDGEILLEGKDVMPLSDERFRREVRWTKMSLVPQAAMNSLNPVIKTGEQVAEPLFVHGKTDSQKNAMERVREVFSLVGMPEDFLGRYPFEYSGGMQQRAAIAMALIAGPDLVVLDEPTSALDILTQANIMNTLKKIKWDTGTTFLLITHDISTSSELADDIGVMYAGKLVERSRSEQFFVNPLHPYSEMLMNSVPRLREDREPESIPGTPPPLFDPPQGCRFAPRCPHRHSRCQKRPPMFEAEGGRLVRCWLYENHNRT